jgi:hypothetical protein
METEAILETSFYEMLKNAPRQEKHLEKWQLKPSVLAGFFLKSFSDAPCLPQVGETTSPR